MTNRTYGQKAVGVAFNPSGDVDVAACKHHFSLLIDQMDALRSSTSSTEVKRMASIAITEMQTAHMWAVKALTSKE